MASRAMNIIRALYGRELKVVKRRSLLPWSKRKLKVQTRTLYREREKLLARRWLLLILGIALTVFHLILAIYYYNKLTSSEQDVFKERAKVSSLLQRRHNISVNLARTVRDYALHEQGIFRHVSNSRLGTRNPPAGAQALAGTQAPGDQGVLEQVREFLEEATDGAGLAQNELARLLAIAEQYPDLKLSDNFRRFMDALIETEKDLCTSRMAYSEVVNIYTTQLRTFPGNLFAKLYGFDNLPYYQADQDAKKFRPVDYALGKPPASGQAQRPIRTADRKASPGQNDG